MTILNPGNTSGRFLFNELRTRYLQRLKAAQETLRQSSVHLPISFDREKAGGLRDLVHRLAGSGATYGFGAVSEAAFAAEDALDAGLGGVPDMEDLSVSLGALRDAVDAAVDTKESEEELTSRRGQKTPDVPPADSGGARKRVLIIDDDPAVSDLLWTAFSRLGLEADVARDGVAGMAAVKEQHPDLIILDRSLPLLSGTSVLMELKADPKTAGIAIIILSAKVPSAWFSAQGVRYIQKPFLPDVVVGEAMRALAEEPALQRGVN